MIMLYVLRVILVYICLVTIVGMIKFNDKIKKKLLMIFSVIYNSFFGYIDTYFVLLLYGYFANMPKGSGYAVPKSEAGFNFMLGIITLAIYLILLLPINLYMKKKGKIDFKVYVIINTIATLIGFIVFWAFLDKGQRLF